MNTVLEALKRLRDGHIDEATSGICCNLWQMLPESESRYFEDEAPYAYVTWPHYSGSIAYPVPATKRREEGEDREDAALWAYLDASSHSGRLWDDTTEYGALRWSLLGHLIEHFERIEE